MTKSDKYEPPDHSTGDAAHLVASSMLSIIPGAAELFQYVVTPPLEKRRAKWMDEVGQALRDLETNQGINLEELQSNDVFIDTVLHASQIALRNSQKDKHKALRNAILNAALPNPPEQSLQQVFLNLVDTFTLWHIRLLKLFQDPQKWAIENNHKFPNLVSGGLSSILESAFPELRGKRAFYDQIWRDLYQTGLVNTDSLYGSISAYGLMSNRTSELGTQFLKFVEKPDEV
jgi:hypothetical protein